MSAPQSPEEIRPVVEALQRLDPLLDVLWDPRAKILKRGSYSVLGKAIPPRYDGRWKVIRYSPAFGDRDDRPYTEIATVGEPDYSRGFPEMKADGGYMPIGEWLVEFMQAWDSANVRQFTELRDLMWRAHTRAAEDAEEARLDDGALQESLDRMHHAGAQEGGRSQYFGQGADFSPTH